jgi:HAD superfamily hydrolase (TIGR01493 family)
MTPLAVIFDIGKVLLDFDYRIAARKISALSDHTPEQVFELLNSHSALLAEYETGLMSTEDFFRSVCDFTGYRGSMSEFRATFGDIFAPIPEMIELHAAVHTRGIPTYIFSNTNEMAVGHIRTSYPFFSKFTDYVFSYEQGAMKPHPRIYESVERFAGVPRDRMFYIDDRPENVEEAQRRGWRTVCHTDVPTTLAAAREAGLL